MLDIRQLSAVYGQHPALQEATLTVEKGEIVVILGANGAGKSTLLKAVAGICEGEVSGDITLAGKSLSGLSSDEIVECGVSLVPEGRGIFGDLTVKENLLLGAYSARARASEAENLQQVLSLFPKLGERQQQIARTMSGGEQQMVAIGRAMMSAPDILMLDEPSLGLAPLLCKELFQNLNRVKQLQIGILLVEQNAKQSLAIADRGYLLENTRITHEDSAANLVTDPAVQKAYLGGGVASAIVTDSKTDIDARPPVPVADKTAYSVGEVRRSADQQIGSSIEDIVAQATQASASTVANDVPTLTTGASLETGNINKYPGNAGSSVASSGSSSTVSSSQIQRITHDIEKAAEQARRRIASRSTASRTPQRRSRVKVDKQQHSADTSGGTAEQAARPPVIEVYKRPRVEVYRRQPGGEFERT